MKHLIQASKIHHQCSLITMFILMMMCFGWKPASVKTYTIIRWSIYWYIVICISDGYTSICVGNKGYKLQEYNREA